MATTYSLRTGLSFCIADGVPVFLDLPANRYFALQGGAADAFATLCGAEAQVEKRCEVPAPLLAKGIVQADADGGSLTPCAVSAATSDFTGAPSSPSGLALLTEAMGDQVVARLQLRSMGLPRVLARIRRKKTALGRETLKEPTGLQSKCSAIARSDRIFTSHNNCLVRSLALTRMLLRHGYPPVLVIGVKFPFAAHCWVQIDGRVLSDSLDRVRSYTPILAA